MDNTAHWPQEIVVKSMEEIATNTCPKERKVRPHKEQALNCPRCNSTNTKFCYYNNYSLSQPRYFCKTCRRYWTEGGSLRNIPVGGGSRKNKRSCSNSISSKNSVATPDPQNPNKIQDQAQDLNLGFSTITPHDHFKTITELIQVPRFEHQVKDHQLQNNPCSTTNSSSALELLNGITSSTSRGVMNPSFMTMPIIHDPNTVYSSGFSLPEFKPSLGFSLDGLGGNYANFQGVQETNGKLFFPYQDLNKQISTNTDDADDQQHRSDQIGDSAGYWNGMIGGGAAGGSW